MRIQLNPIVKKDLKVTARSMHLSWGLFAYEVVLAAAFMLAVSEIQSESNSYYSDGNVYSYLINLFPALAIAQVCIVALIMPIMTASAISGEKERQTFDMMMTTCMSSFSIVIGKLLSAVIRVLFFVIAGMPIMALAFVVGGLEWKNLLSFVFTLILLAMFSGSIGIFCSSLCRKSVSAVILSYVFYVVIYILTFVPALFSKKVDESLLFLLFNPAIFFEEFFNQIMEGESFFGAAGSNFDISDVGPLTYQLSQGKGWMILSAECILLMTLVFIFAAAWNVKRTK